MSDGESNDMVATDSSNICVLTMSDPSNEMSSAALDHLFSRIIHTPLDLKRFEPQDHPSVLIAIIIDHSALFVPEFLEKVSLLEYPETKLDVFVACHSDKHLDIVKQWKDKSQFQSVTLDDQNEGRILRNLRI